MQTKRLSEGSLTRRTLLAGTAAGTLAIGTGTASAQRCPAPPPAHEKGPLVWRDMDQHELDEAYDQSVYAFNAKNISARRAANNKKVTAIIGPPQRLAYGPAEIEKVDLWKTKRPNAPTLIFIHGGAWRGGRSSQVAYMAEP